MQNDSGQENSPNFARNTIISRTNGQQLREEASTTKQSKQQWSEQTEHT